jgi:hypothetical protein
LISTNVLALIIDPLNQSYIEINKEKNEYMGIDFNFSSQKFTYTDTNDEIYNITITATHKKNATYKLDNIGMIGIYDGHRILYSGNITEYEDENCLVEHIGYKNGESYRTFSFKINKKIIKNSAFSCAIRDSKGEIYSFVIVYIEKIIE